jgi:hypothetical protein
MKHLAKTSQTGSERRKRVVIYTRKDSKWRNVKNASVLVDLFDDSRFEVAVHPRIPASFWEQVAFFADIDLLIAPNGGWAPNVLWMPPEACMVEIHQYRLDSWIHMFGLERVLGPGRFLTLTGDYSDPNVKKLNRPGRNGGDDNISSERLAPDLRSALQKSAACQHFLA